MQVINTAIMTSPISHIVGGLFRHGKSGKRVSIRVPFAQHAWEIFFTHAPHTKYQPFALQENIINIKACLLYDLPQRQVTDAPHLARKNVYCTIPGKLLLF